MKRLWLFMFILLIAGCSTATATPTLAPTPMPTLPNTVTPSSTITATDTLIPTPTQTASRTATITPTRTITSTFAPPSIVRLRLVDANTDLEVATIEDCQHINMPDYGIVAFNIRVVTSGQVGSVRMVWGQLAPRFENGSPFAVFGDTAGDYFGMVAEGLFTLSVQAFSGSNGTGLSSPVHTIHLSISNEPNMATPRVVPVATNAPVPSACFCATQWLQISKNCL